MDTQLRKLERELSEDPVSVEKLVHFLEKHYDAIENEKIRKLASKGMCLIGGQDDGIFKFDEQLQDYTSRREHRDLWRQLLKLHNRACCSKTPDAVMMGVPVYTRQEPLYDETHGERCASGGCKVRVDPESNLGLCFLCNPRPIFRKQESTYDTSGFSLPKPH